VPDAQGIFDPSAFDAGAYGRSAARDYDALHAGLDPSVAVRTLTELAAGRPVVEFGIGTGRIALPLAEAGLEVHGIDGSAEMAEELRRKPGGGKIPIVVGNFAEVQAGTGFGLALLAINTIYALPTQDAQVACFGNAARHLQTGGCFVVEAWIPDVGAFRDGTAVRPIQIEDGHIELEVARIRPATQTMLTTKFHLTEEGARLIPANHRYAWPAELDLMARLAGLRLVHRWENWHRAAFQDSSKAHVSVWEKVPEGTW
jgi:SAM-dependent methyltransferase